MSILAVIPARYNSSRFPGKPLADIKGKSMIQRVYELVCKSTVIDKLIIATDDKRIFEHAKKFGAEVMMTSIDHRNGTERIAEVVRRTATKYDAVINIQGDEPFVKIEQIDLLCNIISDSEVDIASLTKQIDDIEELKSPNTVKVVMDKKAKAMYFSRYSIPYQRNMANNVVRYKHIGMYAFKSRILTEIVNLPESKLEIAENLEQLRWLEEGYNITMGITTQEAIGIDTPEDLENAISKL